MRTPQAHFVLISIMLAAFATSCSRPPKFSEALTGKFDPATAFRQHGYSVQNSGKGEGIRNSPYGYGWESWCGVLQNVSGTGSRKMIAMIIRDELTKTLNHPPLDELTMMSDGRPEGQPFTGMLQYNSDNVHGSMHVWLTPGSNAVSYVVFLREERYK
jgi:hypothetical protein